MRPGALLQLEAGCPESPPVYPTCRSEPPESQGAAPREELRPLAAPEGGTSGRGPPPALSGGGGVLQPHLRYLVRPQQLRYLVFLG